MLLSYLENLSKNYEIMAYVFFTFDLLIDCDDR